jgi:EAL domain-containing protein (putative c-di-GMP-specific phosphodiesterase class I)
VMTVAEHVESEDLLLLLKELGCTAGQGFWLHRPVPAECLAPESARVLIGSRRTRRAA